VQIAFLSGGGTDIELICDASRKDIDVGKDISWGFEVDSLDDTLKMIRKKGLKIHSGPFKPTPNIRFFFILDPNGLKIQFVERTEK
jgi:lactoylglutathione lyase